MPDLTGLREQDVAALGEFVDKDRVREQFYSIQWSRVVAELDEEAGRVSRYLEMAVRRERAKQAGDRNRARTDLFDQGKVGRTVTTVFRKSGAAVAYSSLLAIDAKSRSIQQAAASYVAEFIKEYFSGKVPVS